MIFQFRIISDEVSDFAREVLIDCKSTFLDFHNLLVENLGYDPNQITAFFLTNDSWEKELQITLIDMMDENADANLTMDQAVLGDLLKGQGDRLLYVFDFFSERSFFIELTKTYKDLDSSSLPKVSFSHGAPPAQLDLGIDNLDLPTEDDMNEDFLGNSIDDIDLSDGFDIADGDGYYDE